MAQTVHQPRTWLLALIVALSLAGFADAAYLAAKHYTGGPVPCTITGGCEMVLTSRWAELAGIPTAVFGVGYYLGIFFLAIFYLDSRKDWALRLIFLMTSVGLVVSLLLLYLMAFVIHSFCQYCLLSDVITAALFAVSLTILVLRHRSPAQSETTAAARV